MDHPCDQDGPTQIYRSASIPPFCLNPFTTTLLFYKPESLMAYSHLVLIAVQSTGKSTNWDVLVSIKAPVSLSQASCQSSAS